MNNAENHIEELIAKHLAGETTSAEELELSLWLNESEDNSNYFNSLKKIFDESASLYVSDAVDTDAAWQKLKDKISRDADPETKIIGFDRSRLFKRVLRIAAVLLLVAGTGITLYLQLQPESKPVMIASGDSTKEVILPDSSTVFLNKNSSIQYAFSGALREVQLKGEAYFEVVHNEEQPFIVKAGELEIKDIGTAFNVKAFDSDSVEVVVEHGEVALQAEAAAAVHLTKGERSLYRRNEHTITKLSVDDPNALAYRTKIFVFENASLSTVIQKLNDVYGTDILLNDNLKSCRLTSTFKNERINTILEIIAETLQLHISRKNNRLTLEGTGCEK